MACKTCKFWESHETPDSTEGTCHRFPPVPAPRTAYNLVGGGSHGPSDLVWRQPTTDAGDWCGEEVESEAARTATVDAQR